MPFSVLAFATSPRRHGNSETLLDWVLAEMAGEPDVTIEKVALDEVTVNPCRGCNACEVFGKCIQRDDMDFLYTKIVEADCIVFASPVYCLGICAQGKALVDRAQVFRSRKYVLKLPVVAPEKLGKRVGIFISTAGQNWDIVFDGAKMSIRCFFHVTEIKDRDTLYLLVRGVDKAGEVETHPTARDEARAIGKKAVERLREMNR
ncbi:MAG TPA: NAD(P)H-dependent oxidoreductase [Methanomicrobiales archaeon]|nr:NAD(P)H-dependent oxidoreductase [Methanomicrobiales archaeon]